jgi:hypothetical protein
MVLDDVFLTVDGQMVSAAENALITTLETPLAVIWGGVCFSGAPSVTSFVGGIVVMMALAGHIWHSNRSRTVAAPVNASVTGISGMT